MKITNKKSVYKPIYRSNDETILRWDFSPIVVDGKETPLASWQEESFHKSLNLNEIKKIILSYYNNIIDNKIISGFKWKDMQVWLSSENQYNYKAIYDMALQTNGENLPVTFKFGTEELPIFYKFETFDELKDFYYQMINFIKNTVEEGWELKGKIIWDNYL